MHAPKNQLVRLPTGSRLYGTSTENSDFDFKVLYLPALEDLLVGKKMEIYKDKPVGDDEAMPAGAEETEYVPLQIFAKHFFEGQSYAFESAFSITQDIGEYDEEHERTLKAFAKDLIEHYLTKDIRAMVSYAIHQSQMYGVKAERLNAVEALIEVLEAVEHPANTSLKQLDSVLQPLFGDTISYSIIKGTNIYYQEQPALKVNNREYPLTASAQYLLNEMVKVKARYGKRVQQAQGEEIDWKALSHAIRVVSQAVSLLQNGSLVFPLVESPMLLSVKRGEVPFEEAKAIFVELNTRMEELLETTKLPEKTQELKDSFTPWLASWMKFFYHI